MAGLNLCKACARFRMGTMLLLQNIYKESSRNERNEIFGEPNAGNGWDLPLSRSKIKHDIFI